MRSFPATRSGATLLQYIYLMLIPIFVGSYVAGLHHVAGTLESVIQVLTHLVKPWSMGTGEFLALRPREATHENQVCHTITTT
jgi:hypothetical protein